MAGELVTRVSAFGGRRCSCRARARQLVEWSTKMVEPSATSCRARAAIRCFAPRFWRRRFMKSVSIWWGSVSTSRAPPWIRVTSPSRDSVSRSRCTVTGETAKSRASSLIEAPPFRWIRATIWRRRTSAGSCSDTSALHAVLEGPPLDAHLERPELVDRLGQVVGEPVQGLLALLRRGPERVADHARLGGLAVIHREGEVLVAAELDVGGSVRLAEAARQPARGVGAGVDRPFHPYQAGVVGQHLRGLELTRVPAWRFLWRVLQHVFEHANVALRVGLVEGDDRAGLVPDPTQQGVDDLGVGAVPVDEDQLVPAVVDEAPGDVVEHLVQRAGAERYGAGAGAGLAQVLRRIAGPAGGWVGDCRKPGGASGDLQRGDGVGAEREVRTVLLE